MKTQFENYTLLNNREKNFDVSITFYFNVTIILVLNPFLLIVKNFLSFNAQINAYKHLILFFTNNS